MLLRSLTSNTPLQAALFGKFYTSEEINGAAEHQEFATQAQRRQI
jgi:hypothetical protein